MIFSIDIETTGLDPNACQVLEIGIVRYSKGFNDQSWRFLIDHESITGTIEAINMHTELIKYISTIRNNIIHDIFYGESLQFMLVSSTEHAINIINSKIFLDQEATVIGKNFANFDYKFLPGLNIHRRILDIGTLYFDPHNDKRVPDLDECKRRAGIGKDTTHKAIDDAKDVIKLFKKYYQI